MPHWGYSVEELDPDRAVKCSGREIDISPKACREICLAIKGLNLDEVKEFLNSVIEMKVPVPFKKYTNNSPIIPWNSFEK